MHSFLRWCLTLCFVLLQMVIPNKVDLVTLPATPLDQQGLSRTNGVDYHYLSRRLSKRICLRLKHIEN